MLSQIIDLILFPVKELLKLLIDERLTSYLGVSVIGIAVTCMITVIVVAALVNKVNAGEAVASILNSKDCQNSRVERKNNKG